MSRTPLLAVLAAASIAACGCPHPPPVPAAAPAPKVRLGVIVVVDGLAWDRLDGWRDVYTSGLKRLLDEGHVETACRYENVPTETGPGHASIGTGAPPRVHGIVANEWWERDGAALRTVYCADEPHHPGEKGPDELEVDTLGDRLQALHPGAKVVSISFKDRAAMLTAGRDRRHAPFWWDATKGAFVTSAHYDGAPAAARAIVDHFNRERQGAALEARYGRTWSRLPAPARPPRRPPESGWEAYQDPYVGPRFDHDLASATGGYANGLTRSPVADDVLADLAIDLLDDDALALGRDDVPDLLIVSFSAHDHVAHAYGPDSEETYETLRHLDRAVGRLLEAIERDVRWGNVVLGLSSDHGFCSLPEVLARRDPAFRGGRVDTDAVRASMNRPAVGGAGPVERYDGFGIWVRAGSEGIDWEARARDALDGKLAAVVRAGTRAPAGSPDLGAFAANGTYPGRSPDLFVFLAPGAIPDWWHGRGSTHGSHNEYDIHVPLIFWGGPVRRGTDDAAATPYDLAPTLAPELGATMPAATGRALDVYGNVMPAR